MRLEKHRLHNCQNWLTNFKFLGQHKVSRREPETCIGSGTAETIASGDRKTVVHQGKEYRRTFKVCSKSLSFLSVLWRLSNEYNFTYFEVFW